MIYRRILIIFAFSTCLAGLVTFFWILLTTPAPMTDTTIPIPVLSYIDVPWQDLHHVTGPG